MTEAGARPLVSVMMPTYNQAELVDEALGSVVGQDYPHLQVVVSDDASTDGTADRVRAWAAMHPGRVVALCHAENVGVTANCNRALAACEGALVAFFAGDDVYLPGKISAQVAWFAGSPERVLCGHNVEAFDGATGRALYRFSDLQAPPSGRNASLLVRAGHAWHPISNMVRRAAIPAGGFDARVPLASDWKFFVDCVAGGGEFGHVPGVLARYRQWPGNVSRNRRQMWDDVFTTLDLLAAEHPHLRAACAEYRRRAHVLRGRELLLAGEVDAGRLELRRGVHAGGVFAATPTTLLLAAAPRPLVGALLQARAAWRGWRARGAPLGAQPGPGT